MTKISYSGYRFPPEIIHQAIWLYLRFTLSFRDVEDLFAERGIVVSYETVRRWVNHFGPLIAAELRKRRPKPDSVWHLDEGVPRTHQQRWRCGAALEMRAGPSKSAVRGGLQTTASCDGKEPWW
jgi:transposase-like protein